MMRTPTPFFRWPATALLALLLAPLAQANNIQVSNVSLINNGTTAQVQFNLSWENSSRSSTQSNWDAAWVFVKYWNAAGVCNHANLSNTGQVAPAGSQIDLGLLTPGTAYNAGTNPAVGAFIYRIYDMNGSISLTNVQLRWDYGALGLSFTDIKLVQVYAIEMVYVSQGAFASGDAGGFNGGEGAFTLTTINTAVANTVPSGTGSLGGQAGGYPTGQTAPVASYPNGFNAFYCMKYEVTQQGYVDFLNTLTYTQQQARGALSYTNNNRNGIDIQIPGVAPTRPAVYACAYCLAWPCPQGAGRDIACNFLSWEDLTAYLDWSGLRPMTELEFEKACRGRFSASFNYPWGTNAIYTNNPLALLNDGDSNECPESPAQGFISYGNANFSQQSYGGPVRVGSFADGQTRSNVSRAAAGASYYGIMELSGNVYEQTVAVGDGDGYGSTFTGTHGNGLLTAGGNADGATWPAGYDTIHRGGSWQDFVSSFDSPLRLTDRSEGVFDDSSSGGRGVRTAP